MCTNIGTVTVNRIFFTMHQISQLQTLADETRSALINKLSKAGGHQGPNLGVVELMLKRIVSGGTQAARSVSRTDHRSILIRAERT